MTGSACDCLVAGAGPAGALLAGKLAREGRDVVLVHAEGEAHGLPEETLVPGARALFERLGISALLERPAQSAAQRHGTVWGEPRMVWREEYGLRPLQVERTSFDTALREWAVAGGARLVHGRVRELSGQSAPIEVGAQAFDAQVTVAATGRTAAGVAQCDLREELEPTLALSTAVDASGDAAVIEAVPEGWLWWLPGRNGVCLSLFADREEVRARGKQEVWEAALGAATGPAREAGGSPTRGTDATARRRESDVLLVGDAAASLDPLSSQGLEKSLSSAEDTAACVHTLLDEPTWRSLVHEHRRTWERRLFRAHADRTADFYREEQRFADEPFWRLRREPAQRARVTGPLPAALTRSAQLEPVTLLERKAERLVCVDGFRAGEEVLARLGALELAAVLDLVGAGGPLPAIIERARTDARMRAFTPNDLVRALAELYSLGFLVAAP